MTSAINPLYPIAGTPTTQSVRDNFNAAKNEIDALQRQIGFADYNDALTVITPISVSPSTWTKLTNNKLGANTKTDALPSGITNLWNSSTNQLVLSELTINSTIEFRADISITTTAANQVIRFRTKLAIGDPIEFVIADGSLQYKTASSQDLAINGQFYIGYTAVKNNPGEFQLWSDSACTVIVKGWYIRVTKFLG